MRLCFASLALVFVTVAAHADSVTFTLLNPVQSTTTAGSTLSFNATVFAPTTNTGREYLNGDSFNVTSPLVLDDTPFFTAYPAYLDAGQSFTGLLFTIRVPSGTQAKSYSSNFYLLGGATANTYSTLGIQAFTVNVTAPAAVTPEPSSLLLLGTGMMSAVAAFRRRVVSFSR